MMKQIIGRGHKSRGLCILNSTTPRPIVCSKVTIQFETHSGLGHPSFPLLKQVFPRFSSLPSLDCESFQLAKHHHLSCRPIVNKQASAHFS